MAYQECLNYPNPCKTIGTRDLHWLINGNRTYPILRQKRLSASVPSSGPLLMLFISTIGKALEMIYALTHRGKTTNILFLQVRLDFKISV